MSEDLKDLIRRMLDVDQVTRITIDEVYKMPWYLAGVPEDQRKKFSQDDDIDMRDPEQSLRGEEEDEVQHSSATLDMSMMDPKVLLGISMMTLLV